MFNKIAQYLADYVAGTGTALTDGTPSNLLVDDQRRLVISPSGGGSGGAVTQSTPTATPATQAWFVKVVDAAGTVIAFAGLALDATLTGGTAKSIVRGGAKGATTATDVTSTAAGADHQALDVSELFAPVAEDNANGVIAYTRKPLATNTHAPSLVTDFGSATKGVAKASSGNVLGVSLSNANAAARFFQLHNKASAPVAAEVPSYSFYVGPASARVLGDDFFAGSGAAFSTGIVWAWSTTAATFTDAATVGEHTTHVHFK